MKIIGKGHHSIVIDDGNGKISKFYDDKSQADFEKNNLVFLNSLLEKGTSLGFKIPKYLSEYKTIDSYIHDKKYFYKAEMEKIEGITLQNAIEKNLCNSKDMGEKLAKMIYSMHSQLSLFIDDWKNATDEKDILFRHIINDKGKKVLDEGKNQDINRKVKEAMNYLIKNEKSPDFQKNRTLSHLDINFNNVLVNSSFDIEGMVDWGSFGHTHPSLSIYQMVTSFDLWDSFEEKFKKLGGTIEKDILYSAAVINNAWVPFRLREIGLKYDFEESERYVKMLYSKLKKYYS